MGKLDDLLRDARPEAPAGLVHRLSARIEHTRPSPFAPRPALRAAVLSAAMVVALVAVGGFGYAMSVVARIVVDAGSNSTYAKQSTLVLIAANAARAQYGTTTTTQETTTAATTTTTTTATTTTPPPTTTTTETTTTVETTTTTTPTTTSSSPPVVAATAPGSSGTLATSVPGLVAEAVVHWSPDTFSTPVQVMLDPAPALPAALVGSGNSVVSVTVIDQNGNPIHELAAPLEIVFTAPPAGFVPAVSTDGITFRALAMLAGPPLPDSMQDGFYLSANGDVHVLTRHVTYFAIVSKANLDVSASGKKLPAAGSGTFGDPTRNHPGAPKLKRIGTRALVPLKLANGNEMLRLRLALDEQAQLAVTVIGASGNPLQAKQLLVLAPGPFGVSLVAAPTLLKPGDSYRIRIVAVDFDGNKTVTTVPFHVPIAATATTTAPVATTPSPAPATTAPAATTTPAVPKTTTPASTQPATTTPHATTTTPAATAAKTQWYRRHSTWWAALFAGLLLAAVLLGALLTRRGQTAPAESDEEEAPSEDE